MVHGTFPCQSCGAEIDRRHIWRGHKPSCLAWQLALDEMVKKNEEFLKEEVTRKNEATDLH